MPSSVPQSTPVPQPTEIAPTASSTSTPEPSPTPSPEPATPEPQFTLASTAFESGGEIPLVHAQRTFDAPGGWTVTCPGENVSPPLSWSHVPEGAQSLAITCHDQVDLCEKCEAFAPEDRAWPHWSIYNIPPATDMLPPGVPAEPSLPDGSMQLLNGYGEVGYGGPCPPPGHTHTYIFTLYALDAKLDLPEEATMDDLGAAIDSHVLAQAELVGAFTGR
jgi:Raf kinase inhibitor-like YbhB/YbcL family protein